MSRFNATIHAERGVTDTQIEAASLGVRGTLNQTGLDYGIRTIREPGLFPSLPSGQASDAVIAGKPLWDGGGLNVWLTARDLNHYTGRTNFIYGVAGTDGHIALSSHRLDNDNKDTPVQLLTTAAHESGHALGLVGDHEQRHSTKYGFSGHCMNSCTMEASNGLADTQRCTERLLNNIGTAGFCVECLGDLLKFGHALRTRF